MIRSTLLLDRVLSSVRAAAVPLVSASLRFAHTLGTTSFDMSQKCAGLEIQLGSGSDEKLSTQRLRLLSECSFQITLSFTYRSSPSAPAVSGTLTLSNQQLNFHEPKQLWTTRVGVSIRSPLATISIGLSARAMSDNVEIQTKWRRIACFPQQFSVCDFLSKELVGSRYDSPFLVKQRVVTKVLGRPAQKRKEQKGLLLLPIMGIFGPRANHAELLLGRGYEQRWEVSNNATMLIAKAYTCYATKVTVTLNKLLTFGHFEQTVTVESDCVETTGAIKLHLNENFLKQLRSVTPRKLETLSPRVYGLSKRVPKINSQIEQLEQHFKSLGTASCDFNPVHTSDILEQVQGVYEDFVLLSNSDLTLG